MQQSTNTEPVYVISVAARLAGLPCWVLRVLDQEGIVVPERTDSNRRLYSDEDIVILARVRHWTEERGVNIAGVKVILEMEQDQRRSAEARAESSPAASINILAAPAEPDGVGQMANHYSGPAAIAGTTARLPLPAFTPTAGSRERNEP